MDQRTRAVLRSLTSTPSLKWIAHSVPPEFAQRA